MKDRLGQRLGPETMAKQQTQDSYQARLYRVVDHIYAHLDDDIRPEGLAEVACLSPYHWHRIYVAMRGETIGARFAGFGFREGADRLANSDLSLERLRNAPATAASMLSRAPFVRPMARPRPISRNRQPCSVQSRHGSRRPRGISRRDRDAARDALRERRA